MLSKSIITPVKQNKLAAILDNGIRDANLGWIAYALEQGVDPNGELGQPGPDSTNPLIATLLSQSELKYEMMSLLVKYGANPDFMPAGKITAFLRACHRADERAVTIFLDNAQIDLLARDKVGWLSSMVVAFNMGPEMMQKIQDRFERDFLPRHPDLARNHLWSSVDNGGRNVLHICADKPLSMYWLLNHPDLDMVAYLESRDKYGKTPLWEAAHLGSLECVTLLLANGARADVQDNKGNKLLDLALSAKRMPNDGSYAAMRHERMCDMLMSVSASQEARQCIRDLVKSHIDKNKISSCP